VEAVGAAKFDQRAARTEAHRDLFRAQSHDRGLGTGRVVFRQLADGLEQRRAALIVKILGRELLLGTREAGDHVVEKIPRIWTQIVKGISRGSSRHRHNLLVRPHDEPVIAWPDRAVRTGTRPFLLILLRFPLEGYASLPDYGQPAGWRENRLSTHFLMRFASPSRVFLPHESSSTMTTGLEAMLLCITRQRPASLI